jgi:hypothetical protein
MSHCIINQVVPNVSEDLLGLHDLEDEGNSVLQNAGTYSANDTASHPRKAGLLLESWITMELEG